MKQKLVDLVALLHFVDIGFMMVAFGSSNSLFTSLRHGCISEAIFAFIISVNYYRF